MEAASVFLFGFLASAIGSVVGGVFIFLVSALMAIGVPAKTAIIASKIGALSTMLLGGVQFHRQQKIDYQIAVPVAVVSALGSLIGAFLLVEISNEKIEEWVGILILLLLAFVLLKRDLGTIIEAESQALSLPRRILGLAMFFLCGIWAGFLGLGSVIFASYTLLFLYRRSFLETAGIVKVQAFGANVVAAIFFIVLGAVDWSIAGILIVSMGMGAYWGSAFFLKQGEAVTRKLFIAVTIACALKFLLF